MGARGPLKMPSHLRPVGDRDLAGSAAESVPRSLPPVPASVAESASLSRLWEQLVPLLDEAGMLAGCDGLGLELMLRHYEAAVAASDALAAGAQTLDDRKNGRQMKNPAETVFRSHSMAFLEYAKQHGMTFVSRARTPAAKGDGDEQQNPFAETGS